MSLLISITFYGAWKTKYVTGELPRCCKIVAMRDLESLQYRLRIETRPAMDGSPKSYSKEKLRLDEHPKVIRHRTFTPRDVIVDGRIQNDNLAVLFRCQR